MRNNLEDKKCEVKFFPGHGLPFLFGFFSGLESFHIRHLKCSMQCTGSLMKDYGRFQPTVILPLWQVLMCGLLCGCKFLPHSGGECALPLHRWLLAVQ